MKTYKGKSASQILKESKIYKMAAGTVEITYKDMVVNAMEDDDQIHLRNSGGLVASIDMTPRAKVLSDKLIEQRESRSC